MLEGKCHICRETRPIKFCGMCRHYFCSGCRGRYFQRGWEAVKEMVGSPSPDCCGVI